MTDKRLFRPEQLTEAQARAFGEGLDAYIERQQEKDKAREAEIEQKIAAGQYIRKNGKVYDARYYQEATR